MSWIDIDPPDLGAVEEELLDLKAEALQIDIYIYIDIVCKGTWPMMKARETDGPSSLFTRLPCPPRPGPSSNEEAHNKIYEVDFIDSKL